MIKEPSYRIGFAAGHTIPYRTHQIYSDLRSEAAYGPGWGYAWEDLRALSAVAFGLPTLPQGGLAIKMGLAL